MRTYYSRTLRIISAVTLAFFSWTFLSLWEIPAAIAAEKQKASQMRSADSASRNETPKPTTVADKFERVLETIREKVGKAGEKTAKGEDASAEIRELGNRKAQLADLNEQLLAEFAVTEKKISGLPREIRTRHTAFVRNYIANYRQLRDELNDIDVARTPADRKVKLETAQ